MNDSRKKTRCINIDWLELFCLEDLQGRPRNASYFRDNGWVVSEREYGTRVYNEMFTLYGTDGHKLLEIRRNPKSANDGTGHGILAVNACHIRLVNRTCYYANAVDKLRDFCVANGYQIQRIARIDLALDFEYFDYGDLPAAFMERFLKGRYSKINQAEVAVHGQDMWDGRIWNSISWGQPKSDIRTRFYNKTKELTDVKDKPYIRQAWQAAGLIDDWHTMTRRMEDGTEYKPDIWRVEFAITSGTKGWYLMDVDTRGKKCKRSVRNTLTMYDTKQKQLDMFLSLADHYFHFKYKEYKATSKRVTTFALGAIKADEDNDLVTKAGHQHRELQRKDRCADKRLFRITDANEFYKLECIASDNQPNKTANQLLKRLIQYRETAFKPEIVRACNTLIEELQMANVLKDTVPGWPKDELQLIRLLISKRVRGSENSVEEDRQATKELLKLGDVFA